MIRVCVGDSLLQHGSRQLLFAICGKKKKIYRFENILVLREHNNFTKCQSNLVKFYLSFQFTLACLLEYKSSSFMCQSLCSLWVTSLWFPDRQNKLMVLIRKEPIHQNIKNEIVTFECSLFFSKQRPVLNSCIDLQFRQLENIIDVDCISTVSKNEPNNCHFHQNNIMLGSFLLNARQMSFNLEGA